MGVAIRSNFRRVNITENLRDFRTDFDNVAIYVIPSGFYGVVVKPEDIHDF